MKLRRWDALVIAAAATVSAGIFAALGPRAAQADGVDPAERIRKALDGAQKVTLAGCQVSACPVEARYPAGAEQVIVLRATNPTASPVALSLSIVAEDMKFTMSRVVMPVKAGEVRAVECPVALTVEPGQTVETRVAFRLPAGNYSISVTTKQTGVIGSVALCSLLVDAVVAAKPTAGQAGPVVTKLAI